MQIELAPTTYRALDGTRARVILLADSLILDSENRFLDDEDNIVYTEIATISRVLHSALYAPIRQAVEANHKLAFYFTCAGCVELLDETIEGDGEVLAQIYQNEDGEPYHLSRPAPWSYVIA